MYPKLPYICTQITIYKPKKQNKMEKVKIGTAIYNAANVVKMEVKSWNKEGGQKYAVMVTLVTKGPDGKSDVDFINCKTQEEAENICAI